jgi:hypothetical protein
MPTADRYARYRADQTTVWISKTAATFLDRERETPGEGVAAVLDRVLNEFRKLRRAAGVSGPPARAAQAAKAPARAAAKSAAKGAAKGGARGGAARGGAGAAKSAAKRGARTAAKGAGKRAGGRAA